MLNDAKTLSFSVFINSFRGVRKVRARTVPDSPYIHYSEGAAKGSLSTGDITDEYIDKLIN